MIVEFRSNSQSITSIPSRKVDLIRTTVHANATNFEIHPRKCCDTSVTVHGVPLAVSEVGDDLMSAADDAAIVLVNHQSTGDVPTIMYALQHKGTVLNHLMWIQDVLFKYSDFGWVSLVRGDFFIQQVRTGTSRISAKDFFTGFALALVQLCAMCQTSPKVKWILPSFVNLS